MRVVGPSLVVLISLVSTSIWAQTPPSTPQKKKADETLPEKKDRERTYELFLRVGKSTLQGTYQDGDAAPVPFKAKLDCKKIAAGTAVWCQMTGKMGTSVLDDTHLIGVDPETGKVRMLTWTAGGEVHDHQGLWKDESSIQVQAEGSLNQKKYREIIWFTINDADQLISMKMVKTFNEDGRSIIVEGNFKK